MSDTEALRLHEALRGKLNIAAKAPLKGPKDLALLYTPGVAAPCRAIHANPDEAWRYTGRGNLVAVVSDGSAVLGLGNIGPLAGLPVMEGKALLFKEFAGVDAVPLVLSTQNSAEIIETIARLGPSFGGINLEDIAAPRCFEIEAELQQRLDIPVFHDDQHGTAVVVLAGLTNALELTGRSLDSARILINGAGAAGTAIYKTLRAAGARNLVLADRQGLLSPGAPGLSPAQEALAKETNPQGRQATLVQALEGREVFIGVSAPGVLTEAMIRAMAPKPIVFALANPTPEIDPAAAARAGAEVVACGRSDHPNQINNVLAFPGLFRGALDVRARTINEAMRLAAAKALAELVSPEEKAAGRIVPRPFDPRVAFAVARAAALAAQESGVAREKLSYEELIKRLQQRLGPGAPAAETATRNPGPSTLQGRIGDGLVKMGLLTAAQCDEVLAAQKSGDRRLFGEIALAKGFVNFESLSTFLRQGF